MEDEILLRQYSNHIYWKSLYRWNDGDDDYLYNESLTELYIYIYKRST